MTVFQDNIRLSSDIFSFLQKNHTGEVLLTTSKGIYLQISSHILLLADQAYGLTPIGIGLSRFVDFATVIAPQPGQPVSISEGCLHFPGGTLVPCWDVAQPQPASGAILQEQLDSCTKQLLAQCSQRSLASLAAPLLLKEPLPPSGQSNPYCSHALPLLKRLLSALTESDADAITETVSKLLGLGLGLTPSLDDILSGLLYGLLRLTPQEAPTAVLSQAIAAYAPTHTNAISAAYLLAVARGGCFERLDDVLYGLCAQNIINIEPILEIGSSSGSEMLLGLLLAAKITTKG